MARRRAPHRPRIAAALALVALAGSPAAARADSEIVLEGEVPAGEPDHFFLDFEVPPGTLEIQVAHDDLDEDNILDWGLEDPDGFRGWGGGNSEDAIVSELAASRSYLAGPIAPGTWRVVVGKAKLVNQPAPYKVTITLRDAPTLDSQTERQPYVPADLGGGPRWYAGDFHVHSRESGDAQPSLDAIADFARGRGLDFALISDHNTISQLDFYVDAQGRHPDFLFLPGMEFTTYDGHASAIGVTQWVNHRIGAEGATIEAAAQAIIDQGGIMSPNHPAFDLGDLCIGCAWAQPLDPAMLGAVEVATTGLDKAGKSFTGPAIKFWDGLCAEGHHLAAIGGSDDHKGGQSQGFFDSPIGDPTTMVYAESLSAAAILAGIRAGRTVVKLQGPGDPMIELSAADVAIDGDTITADAVTLKARVSGAPAGSKLRFVRNGAGVIDIDITGDPFEGTIDALAPAAGEDRWRAEVFVGGNRHTITSHLWLREDPASSATTTGGSGGETASGGSGSGGGEGSGGATTGAATGTSGASATGGGAAGSSGCACRQGDRGGAPAAIALAFALLGVGRGHRRRPLR